MALQTRSSTAVLDVPTKPRTVIDVDRAERLVEIIAAPYNQPATVEFQGHAWREYFERGAWDSLRGRDPGRVRVNREHNNADLVGACEKFDTADPRGLIATIRVAATRRGDETLQLAHERMLSASVGFSIAAGGEILDHHQRVRRVTRALLHHLALVAEPAYTGTDVLRVRSATATPNLDRLRRDPVLVWCESRCDPVVVWARRRIRRGW